MNKIVILILTLTLLLAACGSKPDVTKVPQAATTQPVTHEPGLNTTPSGFVGFDDPTAPTSEDPTAPTSEDPTAPTSEDPTEPQPTDPKPTEPEPTEPTVDVTMPPELSIAPDAEGLIRFSNMSKREQQNFFMEFGGDPAAFDAWLDMAKAAFKEKYPDVVYDGGPIVLPENG